MGAEVTSDKADVDHAGLGKNTRLLDFFIPQSLFNNADLHIKASVLVGMLLLYAAILLAGALFLVMMLDISPAQQLVAVGGNDRHSCHLCRQLILSAQHRKYLYDWTNGDLAHLCGGL